MSVASLVVGAVVGVVGVATTIIENAERWQTLIVLVVYVLLQVGVEVLIRWLQKKGIISGKEADDLSDKVSNIISGEETDKSTNEEGKEETSTTTETTEETSTKEIEQKEEVETSENEEETTNNDN